jgi:hypothetical protein
MCSTSAREDSVAARHAFDGDHCDGDRPLLAGKPPSSLFPPSSPRFLASCVFPRRRGCKWASEALTATAVANVAASCAHCSCSGSGASVSVAARRWALGRASSHVRGGGALAGVGAPPGGTPVSVMARTAPKQLRSTQLGGPWQIIHIKCISNFVLHLLRSQRRLPGA